MKVFKGGDERRGISSRRLVINNREFILERGLYEKI